MIEPDVAVDAGLLRRIADVIEDRRAVRNRFRIRPRAKRIAHRVHVGIRANARIAKQIPCAADGSPAFEDRKRLSGTVALQMMRGADAGQPGAYNDHIEMFAWQVRSLPFN
jgi:hypothetical protein